jgi:hypothetical protein
VPKLSTSIKKTIELPGEWIDHSGRLNSDIYLAAYSREQVLRLPRYSVLKADGFGQ